MSNRSHALLVGVLAVAACDACESKNATPAADRSSPVPVAAAPSKSALPPFEPAHLTLFAPIPAGVETPEVDDAVKLGQMLFFDARLSRAQDVSCATCHDLEHAGADGKILSSGTKNAKAKRHTPTVINAGGSFAQGWDAGASTIEELVLPHLLDPTIMGMGDEKHVVDLVASIPGYATVFKKAYPEEALSGELVGRAIGTFTKKLFARARWDRVLGGETTAMTTEELGGFAMFVDAGCTTCHQGKYLGATQSQKLGIARPWPAPAGEDPGRFALTKQPFDRGMFKVPTLRNVTRTGPWLHDGSMTDLGTTVRLMARHQVGRELDDAQVRAIVSFLGALTGDPPKVLTTKPTLPPGGPRTPGRAD